MPPPSQAPGNLNAVLPALSATSARESYPSSPHFARYGYPSHGNSNFLSHSTTNPILAGPRVHELSLNPMSQNTRVSYGHPGQQDPSAPYPLTSNNTVPPFQKTRSLQQIYDKNRVPVQVELDANIDKGFFQTDPDQDWTCYRRNYFSVACSYSLKPYYNPTSEPLYLQSNRIQAFAMCISARVDGEDGKVIDLVQHTPKRDKGPMGRPEKVKLTPHPSGSHGIYDAGGGISPSSQLTGPEYEPVYAPSAPAQQHSQTTATFDRIQFKSATANNGKRRAAQQYYHILVELFADVPNSQSSMNPWVRVASRISAPMVVRGRSPGHYSEDRRSSSTSMGPGGGSSGDSGGSQGNSNTAGPSGAMRGGISGLPFSGSSRVGSGTYRSHQNSQHEPLSDSPSKPSSSSSGYSVRMMPLERPRDLVLTKEETSAIDDHDGYLYFPSPLAEIPDNGRFMRPQLPSVNSSAFKTESLLAASQYDSSYGYVDNPSVRQQIGLERRTSIKEENDESHTGFSWLQSTDNRQSHSNSAQSNTNYLRSCGRFQGVESSRGYYPVAPAL